MNREVIFEKNIFEDEKEHLVADEDDAPQIGRSNQFIEVKPVDTNSTLISRTTVKETAAA